MFTFTTVYSNELILTTVEALNWIDVRQYQGLLNNGLQPISSRIRIQTEHCDL